MMAPQFSRPYDLSSVGFGVFPEWVAKYANLIKNEREGSGILGVAKLKICSRMKFNTS